MSIFSFFKSPKCLYTEKEEFDLVEEFIKEQIQRKVSIDSLDGFKLDRKKTMTVKGEKYKLSHSFFIKKTEKGKQLKCYLLTHYKDGNIPEDAKEEKSGALGKGGLGQVKIIKTRAANGNIINHALKIIPKSDDSEEAIKREVGALKAMMMHSDNFKRSYSSGILGFIRKIIAWIFKFKQKHYLIMKMAEGKHILTPANKNRVEVEAVRIDAKKGTILGLIINDNLIINKHITDKLKFALKLSKIIFKLHNRGYVHLDLSIDNILVNKNQDVSLVDFGSCRTIGSKLKMNSGEKISFKPIYFDPEVVPVVYGSTLYEIGYITYSTRVNLFSNPSIFLKKEHTFTGKEDVYSLGIIFSMLFSKKPQNNSDDIDNLIKKMTAYRPGLRPNMGEVITKLELLQPNSREMNPVDQSLFSKIQSKVSSLFKDEKIIEELNEKIDTIYNENHSILLKKGLLLRQLCSIGKAPQQVLALVHTFCENCKDNLIDIIEIRGRKSGNSPLHILASHIKKCDVSDEYFKAYKHLKEKCGNESEILTNVKNIKGETPAAICQTKTLFQV